MDKRKTPPIAGNHSKLFFVVLGMAVILLYWALAHYIYQSYQDQRVKEEITKITRQA